MSIHVLSPIMVSKIAAGEVVERPASVVKELVENALDAGATRISVDVEGGGIGLIRVVDNGAGIPENEVKLAFERHATSKIACETDIENISSLGFRGEALPTIASVSAISMLTRRAADEAGTRIVLEYGSVKEVSKQGCPEGTAVTVRDLFKNVPARLKFLKSVATEGGHISHLVSQYSLAYPEVKFTLTMNGRKVLDSTGNSSLVDAAIEVYGLETGRAMLEVAGTGHESGPSVIGLVSPPNVSRAGRNYLTFFVNRRWVQNRMLSFAVEEAYQGMLMTGRHPIVILDIRMSPADVDVNVHPTKREIKFRDEQAAFLAVQRAVRVTLTRSPTVPALPLSARRVAAADPVSLPLPFAAGITTGAPTASEDIAAGAVAGTELPILRVIGQHQGTYIVAEGPEGLYLIDQHAAHERVLYDKIRAQMGSRQVEVQGLLSPLTVELTSRQAEAVEALRGILEEGGFRLDGFGERTLLLRAVPAIISEPEAIPALMDILDTPGEEKARSDLRDGLAASLACHGSVRAGQQLSRPEMEGLLQQLEMTAAPRTCPHGRPTMMFISASRLESEFGRH